MELIDIKEASRSERPLEYTTTTQGPGGQAYDHAPNAPRIITAPEETLEERFKALAVNYPVVLVGAGVALGIATGALLKRL